MILAPPFPTPTVGVAGLVFDATDRILLVRRKNPPGEGEWHIPGGKLEPGETLEACCIREVFEETQLNVIPEALLAIADRRLAPFHYVVIDFLCALAPGADPQRLAAGTDATEARWVDPTELGAMPLVEGLRAVIAAGHDARRQTLQGLRSHPLHRWLYL